MLAVTYDIAMAAARDAGTRHARANGRAAWNREDRDQAVTVFDQLYPLRRHLQSIGAPEYEVDRICGKIG